MSRMSWGVAWTTAKSAWAAVGEFARKANPSIGRGTAGSILAENSSPIESTFRGIGCIDGKMMHARLVTVPTSQVWEVGWLQN